MSWRSSSKMSVGQVPHRKLFFILMSLFCGSAILFSLGPIAIVLLDSCRGIFFFEVMFVFLHDGLDILGYNDCHIS